MILAQLAIPISLLLIGYFWGTHNERKHYASIIARERQLSDIIVIASRQAPESSSQAKLMMGSVVIASDYFKRLVGWLIGIFGGRINAYESLLDRARREALLRLKSEAKAAGANMIVNLKYETSKIGLGLDQNQIMVEVLAYGTSVYYTESES